MTIVVTRNNDYDKPFNNMNNKSNTSRSNKHGKINLGSIFMLIIGISVGYLAFATTTVSLFSNTTGTASQQLVSEKNGALDSFTNGHEAIKEPTSNNIRRNLDSSAAALDDISTEAAQKRFVENQMLLASQSIPTSTTPDVMKTPKLPDSVRKKIMVTGGAGFVGSHLVDKLMMLGHEVIVVDNFFTGQKKNIEHWLHHPNFR